MTKLNRTHDPARRSWVQSANQPDCDFPIQNLPFGIFRQGGGEPRGGVAIGDQVLDLRAALDVGLFQGEAADAGRAGCGPTLNPLMALGIEAASVLRARISDLLSMDAPERGRVPLISMSAVEMQLPATIFNYTDFICSSFHALRAFRKPLDSPLSPVMTHMPVAYHGRASSVRISGEEVRRPNGQSKTPDGQVQFGPSKSLDFELEVGAFVALGNELGSSVPMEDAPPRLFGYCLLNDWSARDIQFWESMLGPFLGKSFSTTISPWVVTAEALAPFRTAVLQPGADYPEPLPYLDSKTDRAEGGLDIDLEAYLQTPMMRETGQQPARIVTTNLRFLYWSFAQMLTHHASNGCNLQPGDLIGSGTVSGPTDESRACLLEHTEPVALPNGETRQYLEDGDEVVFRGRAHREGYVSIGFGECHGRIVN